MKSYNVEIKEILVRCITVEAISQEDALIQIKQSYNQEDIVLGSEDYVDTEYSIIE